VHALRTVEDALALRAALDGASELVIAGGGLVGLEVASSAASLGVSVTVIEAGPAPGMRALGRWGGELLARLHRSRGVEILTGSSVARVHRDGGRARGVTSSTAAGAAARCCS
jgi:3-phenylpropionate/trans-cinnamate dioxygenase ferredoxin reductase component